MLEAATSPLLAPDVGDSPSGAGRRASGGVRLAPLRRKSLSNEAGGTFGAETPEKPAHLAIRSSTSEPVSADASTDTASGSTGLIREEDRLPSGGAGSQPGRITSPTSASLEAPPSGAGAAVDLLEVSSVGGPSVKSALQAAAARAADLRLRIAAERAKLLEDGSMPAALIELRSGEGEPMAAPALTPFRGAAPGGGGQAAPAKGAGKRFASTHSTRSSGGSEARKRDLTRAGTRKLQPLRCRSRLEGHYGRVVAATWAADGRIFDVAQDGKLFVWDPTSARHPHWRVTRAASIPMSTAWSMSCAVDPVSCSLAAVGSVDTDVKLYRVGTDALAAGDVAKPCGELSGHAEYIGAIDFPVATSDRLLTASGDGTVGSWDLRHSTLVCQWTGHERDVMSLDCHPGHASMAATGGADSCVRLWDARVGSGSSPAKVGGGCVMELAGHAGDVNAVRFHPSGTAVFSGAEDGVARLWDLRTGTTAGTYVDEARPSGAHVTDLVSSRSGRALTVSYTTGSSIATFDALYPGEPPVNHLPTSERVSCLAMHPQGLALASGCWDTTLSIWGPG